MVAGGGRRLARAAAALRGPAAARVRGEMSREARAFYCPPHLGLEWSEEAARRWPAAASGGARSGGVAQLGRRLEVAVGVVVVGKRRKGLFIGVEGGGQEGTRRWPAGGLGGAPLMVPRDARRPAPTRHRLALLPTAFPRL